MIIQNELRTTSVQSDRTIKSLFIDLEQIVLYLNNHLPPDFSQAVSKTLMPGLCTKITETWLDSAIPSSISDMTAFRQVIALVQIFAEKLDVMDWTGAADMHHWVANAPRLWLSKRRESSLDWTRNQLSLGKLYSIPSGMPTFFADGISPLALELRLNLFNR